MLYVWKKKSNLEAGNLQLHNQNSTRSDKSDVTAGGVLIDCTAVKSWDRKS